MNPRLRSALLLLATLLIGMVLGALVRSSISGQRMHRAGLMRTEDSFIASYERTIKPVNDQQATRIREVLSGTAPEVIALFRSNQTEMRQLLDDMRSELEPLLDEEQKARLEERSNRRRNRDAERK